MTNSLIPYSFIPGTKALASEVNANFIALANAVEEGKTFTTESIEEFNTTLEATLDESMGNKLETNLSNSRNVSNCILEISQDVLYDINSAGGVSLKAGSTVYVSTNGTFEAVTLDTSTSYGGGELWTTNHSRKLFLVYIPATNNVIAHASDYTYTQANAPTNFIAGIAALWYDTNNHIMKSTYNSGATWEVCSLPLMIGCPGETNIGWRGYVDTVFNGMGFFGQCTFTLPGLKCLFADGRNSDGSFKNKLVENKEVKIQSIANQTSLLGGVDMASDNAIALNGYGVKNYFEQEDYPRFNGTHGTWYNIRENYVYVTSDGGTTWNRLCRIMLPNLTKTPSSANISAMSSIQSVKLLDTLDLNWLKSSLEMPVSKSLTGYTKLTNGIIIQWGVSASVNTDALFTITFPTPFTVVPSVIPICRTIVGDVGEVNSFLGSVSTTNFVVKYNRHDGSGADGGPCNWIAIGY